MTSKDGNLRSSPPIAGTMMEKLNYFKFWVWLGKGKVRGKASLPFLYDPWFHKEKHTWWKQICHIVVTNNLYGIIFSNESNYTGPTHITIIERLYNIDVTLQSKLVLFFLWLNFCEAGVSEEVLSKIFRCWKWKNNIWQNKTTRSMNLAPE